MAFLQCTSEAAAADLVRRYCGVASRREIAASPQSASAWNYLDNEFEAWKLADKIGALQ